NEPVGAHAPKTWSHHLFMVDLRLHGMRVTRRPTCACFEGDHVQRGTTTPTSFFAILVGCGC
ncbi:hypothetical protein JTE90_020832, partial [Oedothorax gibbosus]